MSFRSFPAWVWLLYIYKHGVEISLVIYHFLTILYRIEVDKSTLPVSPRRRLLWWAFFPLLIIFLYAQVMQSRQSQERMRRGKRNRMSLSVPFPWQCVCMNFRGGASYVALKGGVCSKACWVQIATINIFLQNCMFSIFKLFFEYFNIFANIWFKCLFKTFVFKYLCIYVILADKYVWKIKLQSW